MDIKDIEEKVATFFNWLTAFFNTIIDGLGALLGWAEQNDLVPEETEKA